MAFWNSPVGDNSTDPGIYSVNVSHGNVGDVIADLRKLNKSAGIEANFVNMITTGEKNNNVIIIYEITNVED